MLDIVKVLPSSPGYRCRSGTARDPYCFTISSLPALPCSNISE